MKRLILSASAATLTLASMTAAAWWATPYHAPYWGPHAGPYAFGAPYAVAPPSPQQLREMAKRHREAAMERMQSRHQAPHQTMNERAPRRLPVPEMPDFAGDLSLPEPPSFGQRPEMPAMPELPLGSPMDAPMDSPMDPKQRQAEIDAYRAALKQQAEERRAAMQAISEQRRGVNEQRRQDWRCARQMQRPLPYADAARDCAPASDKSKADSSAESSGQTAGSAPTPNKAS